MKKILLALLAIVFAWSCTPFTKNAHPEWSYSSVVYELNVRQCTAEGTFAEAEKLLPSIKELGVDIVWLMPIHPIGEKGRKGSLGSYYAIRDYYEVNPEFGTMEDFQHFLDTAHSLGLRVILDYVANHTSPDNAWVSEKPASWYVRDENGEPIVQYDWTDIAKLNYENEDLCSEMKRVLHFWTDKGVDGFRCDAAKEMPDSFWQEAWTELREKNPELYLLAEGEGANFHEDGFDATYAWELHHIMNEIAQGEKASSEIADYVERDMTGSPKEAFRLMFTSNHDENSWAGTEFERMGEAAEVMAMLCYTLPKSQPLIYTGQEVGFNRRLKFFDKDLIEDWTPNEHTLFYKRMNALRHENAALRSGEKGGTYRLLESNGETGLYAFVRATAKNNVIVVANISGNALSGAIDTLGLEGEYTNAMTGEALTVNSILNYILDKWTYLVLTR